MREINTENVRKVVINPVSGSAVISIPKELVLLYKITAKDKVYFSPDGDNTLHIEILRDGVIKLPKE